MDRGLNSLGLLATVLAGYDSASRQIAEDVHGTMTVDATIRLGDMYYI